MKLRSFRTAILLVIVATLFGLGISYRKAVKNRGVNEMKNQLTEASKSNEAAPKNLRAIIAKNIEKQEEMVERTDFAPPLLQQERFYTEEEISTMTEAQFEILLKTTESKLPRVSDIKKIPPGALHRTPQLIIQAGRDMGVIKEVLKNHGSYEKKAQAFYQQCSLETDRPTPVRALCLTNLIEIKKKKGEKIDKKAYPAELLELSKMVTDL